MENTNYKESVLPYRTSGKELTRLIDTRARGRSVAQIKSLGFSDKDLQGSLVAAYQLGFINSDSDELTTLGNEYALASPEKKVDILLKALLKYEPYELLLEAIIESGHEQDTPVDWIVAWFNSSSYGSSPSNRSDGAVAFARFVEYCNLGQFFIGRRGKQSRIEWQDGAFEKVKENLYNGLPTDTKKDGSDEKATIEELDTDQNDLKEETKEQLRIRNGELANSTVKQRDTSNNNSLVLNLGNGKFAELNIPSQLTSTEKDRLLKLVELMIVVCDEDSASNLTQQSEHPENDENHAISPQESQYGLFTKK